MCQINHVALNTAVICCIMSPPLVILHCRIIIYQLSFLTHHRPNQQHVVDEEAILQLMKNCPMCNRKCRCSKHSRGPYLIVYQGCYFCNYQHKWGSQPEATNINIYKPYTQRKRKSQTKDKASVNAKAQSSQLNKWIPQQNEKQEAHSQLCLGKNLVSNVP